MKTIKTSKSHYQGEQTSKIYVVDHQRLVESALMNQLENLKYHNQVISIHAELNLVDQRALDNGLFKKSEEYGVGVIIYRNNIFFIKQGET
jgi:hypothetical protein